jgi:hypothetical protein
MLPDISTVYEEKIPHQPLTTLIGLNFEETHLLTELSNAAKILAPSLGKELSPRIQEFTGWDTKCTASSTDLQLYLQDWFLQLFQCREEKFIGFQEYFLRVPLNLMFTGIDLILSYGHEVTRFSLHPEAAIRAFHKALALKIVNEQLQLQADEEQHLYGIMLLD